MGSIYSSSDSVTTWLEQLKKGDSYAAQKLWERYMSQLVRLADDKLRGRRLRLGDGEDVALVAFTSFLKCIEEGRFPQLEDRFDLWQVLIVLTDRRAKDHLDKEYAAKRGFDQLVGESAVSPGGSMPTLDVIAEGGPGPDFAIQVTEEMETLFKKLGDDELVRIARAKLEGYTNKEIAQQEDIGLRTLERRLSLIRNIWECKNEDE